MSEKSPSMHPDLAQALRAYEAEMLDGTERSQKAAFETLKLTRRRLGEAAIVKAMTDESSEEPAASEAAA